jgi:hypothetical protein
MGLLAASSLAGCATVCGGCHDQSVHIDSEPKGAQVWVDGKPSGLTPTDIPLCRRQEHQVQIDIPGSQPYVTTLKPGINPWVFGNILVGGVPGLLVDACTGATSTLYPKSVTAQLAGPQPLATAQASTATGNAVSPPNAIQPVGYRLPADTGAAPGR